MTHVEFFDLIPTECIVRKEIVEHVEDGINAYFVVFSDESTYLLFSAFDDETAEDLPVFLIHNVTTNTRITNTDLDLNNIRRPTYKELFEVLKNLKFIY